MGMGAEMEGTALKALLSNIRSSVHLNYFEERNRLHLRKQFLVLITDAYKRMTVGDSLIPRHDKLKGKYDEEL